MRPVAAVKKKDGLYASVPVIERTFAPGTSGVERFAHAGVGVAAARENVRQRQSFKRAARGAAVWFEY